VKYCAGGICGLKTKGRAAAQETSPH